jgi:hypothetical protein
MTHRFGTLALLVLVVAAGGWHPARAAEFRCWNGGLERRIELSGSESTSGWACEVRYWRDATAPDGGRVLWRAQQDADFCAAKARELVARLAAGGWRCDTGEQPPSPEPAQARGTDAPPATQAPAQAAPGAGAPDDPADAVEPEGPPAATVRDEPPAATARDEPPAVGPTEPSSPGRAQSEASGLDAPVAPPSAHSAAPLLDQVLEETLRSVKQLYGGDFQAEHTAFGDLDGDGLQDAAVLITYEAERDEYVQYLVAYLFNGETFQSVATKNVGGRFLDALRADLRGIDDGRILLELDALDGGAVCCATRRTAFILDGGQLVELPDPDARDAGQTRQAGPASPG